MPRKIFSLSLLTVAAASLLTGCGGGGGGGGSSTSSTPSPIILTGTVDGANGIASGGTKVTDPVASTSATTASDGSYAILVPASESGGTAVLDYYNSSNEIVLVNSYSITASSGQTQNVGTVSLGPPPPPSTPGVVAK